MIRGNRIGISLFCKYPSPLQGFCLSPEIDLCVKMAQKSKTIDNSFPNFQVDDEKFNKENHLEDLQGSLNL